MGYPRIGSIIQTHVENQNKNLAVGVRGILNDVLEGDNVAADKSGYHCARCRGTVRKEDAHLDDPNSVESVGRDADVGPRTRPGFSRHVLTR